MSRDDLAVSGKKCELKPIGNGKPQEFELLAEGKRIRIDASPRVLSHWALENGAVEVQWAFDLKIAEPSEGRNR